MIEGEVAMIEVHHLNNSRSQRVLWLLEELGAEYRIMRYQRDAQTMLAPPELKAIHPLGKSPVITEGDLVLAESGAIIEHLIERHGKGRFAPPRHSADFIPYRYWMHYAEGSLMTQMLVKLYLGRVGEAAKALAERIDGSVNNHLAFLESELGARPYFVGAELTGADIQMSFPLEWAKRQGMLAQFPKLTSLVASYQSRPAYRVALEKGGPYAFAD
jgi:glutathione S-transferase